MLMSCRVIGRNVELAFFDFLVERLMQSGTDVVRASYRKTQKNLQVSEFYDRLGFSLVTASEGQRDYALRLAEYIPMGIDYVEVSYG